MARGGQEDSPTLDGRKAEPFSFTNVIPPSAVGLVRTVVSISHCGCDDPGSIPGLDNYYFCLGQNIILQHLIEISNNCMFHEES